MCAPGRSRARATRGGCLSGKRGGLQNRIPHCAARWGRSVFGYAGESLLRREWTAAAVYRCHLGRHRPAESGGEPAVRRKKTRGGGEISRAVGSGSRCRGRHESRRENRLRQCPGGGAV